MEEFNGASRATVRSKTPTGMWEHARNIVLTKGRSSIVNEDGFEFKHQIPGELIGEVTTTEHVVVFSVDGEYSCIGYKNENDEDKKNLYMYWNTNKTKTNRLISGISSYRYVAQRGHNSVINKLVFNLYANISFILPSYKSNKEQNLTNVSSFATNIFFIFSLSRSNFLFSFSN